MLDDDGNWQTVTAVRVEQKPLNSYNLEVNIDHTFFIRGIGGLDGIWVHNENCWTSIPSNSTTKQVDNQLVHTFNDRGRTVEVIDNPNYVAGGTEKRYIEVSTASGKVEVTNAGQPNVTYNTNKNGVTQAFGDNGQFTNDPNKTNQSDTTDYSWIDELRNPDPNVQSGFVASKPAPSTNQYFTTETQWQAPGKGTGLKYKVYQQDIDLNAVPNAHLGSTKTNAELMESGNAPYVLKNGSYEQVQLHHNVQDGRGSIYELSKPPHQADNQSGGLALHPFGNSKHPEYPVNRPMFDKDRNQYWKDRLNQLRGN